MQVLKIKLYQNFVNYRKPLSYKSGETFPLPPPSTINGFLHNVLSATGYIPMSFSIQGTYKSITNNLQTLYKFGGEVRKDTDKITGKKRDRNYWAVIGKTPIQKNVFYQNLLVEIFLIIHIKSKLEILKQIERNIIYPKEYLSLGRKEDLVRIDDVKFVDLVEKEDKRQGIEIKNPIYVPKQDAMKNNLEGINFRLNSTYEIVNGFKKWDIVDMVYIEPQKIHQKIYLDSDGDVIFWHKDDEF